MRLRSTEAANAEWKACPIADKFCTGPRCMAWVETSKTHGVCGMLPMMGVVDSFNIELEETNGPVNADVT